MDQKEVEPHKSKGIFGIITQKGSKERGVIMGSKE